jgi:hypothetical protein
MPEATPKREAVRERMFDTTYGSVSWFLGGRFYLVGVRVRGGACRVDITVTHLCIVLDGLLDYR